MILVTDGKNSFLIFQYGETQWGSDYPNETYELAFGGAETYACFNRGPIHDVTTLSNAGFPSLFMFRVDLIRVIVPSSHVAGKYI